MKWKIAFSLAVLTFTPSLLTAQAEWQNVPQFTSRRGAACAYDPVRGETVIFGGDDGRHLDETWVWNGSTLQRRFPAAQPSARAEATLVFDSIRNRLVLFGGSSATASYTDTWAWDGTTWTVIPTATNPAVSSYGRSLTFDPLRDRIWLWAGQAASTGQLWQFNGTNWAIVNGALPWPSYDQDGTFAFDPDTGTVALYHRGGAQGSMWRWNGSTWTQQTGPSFLQHVAGQLVHDPVGHRLLLVGGWTTGSQATVYQWSTGTAQWLPIGTGGPATQGHDVMFDTQRSRVVVVGGLGIGTAADSSIWEWSPSTWQRRLGAAPGGRTGHALAYDDASQRVLMFGGAQGYGDLWVRESGDWRMIVPGQVSSPTHPGGIWDTHIVFDAARNELLLCGGLVPMQFWRQTGAAWQPLTVAGVSNRRDPGLVYDGTAQRVLLFGGGPYPYLNDTWSWNGTSWTQVVTATSPPARANAAMAWDASRQRVVMLGGFLNSGVPGDTWEFDGTNWSLRGTGGPGALGSNLTYDSVRQVVTAFVAPSFGPMQTWQWDGQLWSQLTAGTPPATRPGAAIVGTRDDVLAVGGQLGSSSTYTAHLSLLTPAVAQVESFGAPGTSSAGPLSLTGGAWRPWLGTTFTVSCQPMPLIALPGLYAGFSRQSWLGTPLPIDLGILGWPGNSLHISPDVPLSMLNQGTGAVAQIVLPLTPSLAGSQLHLQSFVFEPLGGQLATSNGLTLTFGIR